MNCKWCGRDVDMYYIEMRWVDREYVDELVEIYCSSACIRKVME